MSRVRGLIPYLLLPLALLTSGLASTPWLRAYPASVLALPLFAAAALSVLVPILVVGVGIRRLWLTAIADAAVLVFYELFVTLREPSGFPDLWAGLLHGPSRLLTYALPLVGPRTLLVAPVALAWVCGAILGECLARAWQSVVPYLGALITFGLAYAGTARAVTDVVTGRRVDTILAAALLVALLLLRAAQSWVAQDEDSVPTSPDGLLPLRGLATGVLLTVVLAAAAAAVVQAPGFARTPAAPVRIPDQDESRPLTPISFVAGLRPHSPTDPGDPVFTVSTVGLGGRYIQLATADSYNGDGWTFDRTFRPSGGVIPAEQVVGLRSRSATVVQQYTIDGGTALADSPWMPAEYRAQRITGRDIDVDATSGMIVPTGRRLGAARYTVNSSGPDTTFTDLPAASGFDGFTGTDTDLPPATQAPLATLLHSLTLETGVSTISPVAFLQAVQTQLRTKSSLAGGSAPTGASGAGTSAPSTRASVRTATPTSRGAGGKSSPRARRSSPSARTKSRRPSARRSSHAAGFAAPVSRPSVARSSRSTSAPRSTAAAPSPSASGESPGQQHGAGTTFADVLASIRQARSASPEQYATFMCLVARALHIPARIATGFRIGRPQDADTPLPSGSYTVRTSEAWTWVEIPIAGKGWVVLDAAPSTYAGPSSSSASGSAQAAPPTTASVSPPQLSSATQGHAVAPPSQTPQSEPLGVAVILVLIVGGLVVLAVVIVILLLTRKVVRARRRRRPGDPRRRLLGAWQESLDVLQESGLPDVSALTSREIGALTGARFGDEPAAVARRIGDLANTAIFSPTTWINAAEADDAWLAQERLGRAVRRQLGWRDRLASHLRYHRPPRSSRPAAPASWSSGAGSRPSGRPGSRGRRRH